MKSIQNQYRDLIEGKMSKPNFMRNLRMTLPQFVTNVTSFDDAVKILKNKSILTESTTNDFPSSNLNEVYEGDGTIKYIESQLNYMVDGDSITFDEFKAAMSYLKDHSEEIVKEFGDNVSLEDATKIAKTIVDTATNKEPEEKDMDEEEFDALLQQFEDEKAGEIAVKSDVLDEPLEETEELNEAKKKEEKAEYSHHQCNPTELRLGIKTELEHNDDMELDKAKEIAYKNIGKDPIYYTKLKLSGAEAYAKKSKEEKAPVKKKKEAIQLVDLANGMQKVKMPKAEEKKKLKEQVEEAMPFQDLPADPEVYKTVKDMKGKIMKATNAEGIEFQRGDVVKTYDGEEIKIADFKEEQGKIKALYNKGMFFSSIDIDGLEAPKATMRPGVDIGKSFEKWKMRDLQEVIREVINEYFDGRDNLIDPIAAEEEA